MVGTGCEFEKISNQILLFIVVNYVRFGRHRKRKVDIRSKLALAGGYLCIEAMENILMNTAGLHIQRSGKNRHSF